MDNETTTSTTTYNTKEHGLDVAELMESLNVDATKSNTALFNRLKDQAEYLIITSIDSKTNKGIYYANPLFNAGVATLVTQFYYDRTLENGTSKGVQMYINKIKGDVLRNVQPEQ